VNEDGEAVNDTPHEPEPVAANPAHPRPLEDERTPEVPQSEPSTGVSTEVQPDRNVGLAKTTTFEGPEEGSTPPVHDSHTTADTVVIEDAVIKKRLRRPWDLVRLLVALAAIAAVLAIAHFATGATTGLGEDLGEASRQLPDFFVLVLNVVGGLGLLTLPVASAVDLLIRGRGRQLLDAMLALFIAVSLLTLATLLVENYGSLQIQLSLA
jgi:hypothetical protein